MTKQVVDMTFKWKIHPCLPKKKRSCYHKR